jgi:hypothetical protein
LIRSEDFYLSSPRYDLRDVGGTCGLYSNINIVGLLAALAAGPELGVALGLLGGGLGVWALMRSGILR